MTYRRIVVSEFGNGYILAIMSNYDVGAEPLQEYIRSLIENRLQP